MSKKTFTSPKAFRTSLEERLKIISAKEKIGIPRLRKQVAYDRLLSRLFSAKDNQWLLKGGYAMQLRVQKARGTQDIDLAMKEMRLKSTDEVERGFALLSMLQTEISKEFDDFFTFIITGPVKDLDAAPYGGSRFHIEAQIDGRSFEKFHLDIGIGDVWIEPIDHLTARGWLEFAGIEPQIFPAISKEQQFAEKIHAYTLPRGEGRQNSRVKDLVDMVLLIETGEIDLEKLATAIHSTFKRRDSHTFSDKLPQPPTEWKERFESMAEECDISPDMAAAFLTVQDFINRLSG